eukprot:scaffold56169_cov81-Phaeocystis_antarctica.AAC.4
MDCRVDGEDQREAHHRRHEPVGHRGRRLALRGRGAVAVAHRSHDCGGEAIDDAPQDLRLLVRRALPQRLQHDLRRP